MSRIDDLLADEGARAEAYSGGPAPEHVTTSRPNLGRQTVVSVRLAADEHERLSQAARKAGMSLSTLIRVWAVDRLHAEDHGESGTVAERLARLEREVFTRPA